MALDRSQLIKLYANRLVNSLVPSEFGQEYIQSITNDLLGYLLSTKRTNQYDINQITNHFKTVFLSNGMKQEWIKFQNVLEGLSKSKSIEQICNYLIFLNYLQENRSQSSLSPRRISSQLSNRSYSSRPEYQLQSSPYRESINITNAVTLDQLIKPYYESLSEDIILTYLPYTLLGLDSKLLSFQEDNKIELPSNLNSSYSGLLHNILEAALLYKNLKKIIELNKGRLNSPIKTAYLTVLESQLNFYVNHINKVFNKQSHSLFSVYYDIFNWILKLRLLYSLVKQLHLNGYDFLSKVHELTKFGDIRIKDLADLIFQQITIPYYEILEHWIINGELIDNSNEFFIAFNVEKNNFNDIIEFIPSRIPFFIKEDLSYKIFQIGKMLIFLSKYCKELNWINEYNKKYSNYVLQINNGLQSMPINLIIDLVNLQYKELLNYFTVIVQGKNELFQHLINLKKFLLMTSNDFIESIILKGLLVFNESSANVSSNYLSKILNESINYSSVRNSRYCSRLDARVLDPTHGNIGWEVFTLEYKIEDLPIHYLLDSSMIQYLKMFNFLWRLRHFQFLLNLNFLNSCNIRKNELKKIRINYSRLKKQSLGLRDKKIVWIMRSFNTVNLIRNQLTKFLDSLVKYISFDIIEANFNKLVIEKLFKSCSPNDNILLSLNKNFIKSLKSNPIGLEENCISHNMNEITFDGLIDIHINYLNKITNIKIISDSTIGKTTGESYIKQIYSILEVIFKFIKSSEQYYDLITNYIVLLNIEENLQVNDEIDDDLEEIETNLRSIINKIYKQLYLAEFKVNLECLVKDFRSDLELKDLSRVF